jgi:hypothetical protein
VTSGKIRVHDCAQNPQMLLRGGEQQENSRGVNGTARKQVTKLGFCHGNLPAVTAATGTVTLGKTSPQQNIHFFTCLRAVWFVPALDSAHPPGCGFISHWPHPLMGVRAAFFIKNGQKLFFGSFLRSSALPSASNQR